MAREFDQLSDMLRVDIGTEPTGVLLCTVGGAVDAVTADELRTRLAEAARTTSAMVVDLSAVSFFASAGVRVLLETADEAPDARLAVVTGPTTRTALEICGVPWVIPCFHDRDRAVAACSSGRRLSGQNESPPAAAGELGDAQ